MASFKQGDRHLDMTGRHCPQPVLYCMATLSKMRKGETLRLTASDPDSRREIPLLVAALQDELLEVRSENGLLQFLIKRHGAPCQLRPRRPIADLIAMLRDLASGRSVLQNVPAI